jgi:VWFA-related protein
VAVEITGIILFATACIRHITSKPELTRRSAPGSRLPIKLLAILSAACAAWLWCAQPIAVTAQQPAAPQPPMMRVAVTTVQVDAVVTDRNGNLVTDLQASDFEIRQDGRPQTIQTFTFVSASGEEPGDAPAPPARTVSPAVSAAAPEASASSTPASTAPAAPAPPSGRTLVAVIDDLSLSVESMRRTKQALHKIIDAQLSPTDRIAIVRTSGGSGLTQQFTSDKGLLHQLVERLRFNARQFERDDWQTANEKQRLRNWPPIFIDSVTNPPRGPADTLRLERNTNEDNVRAERAFGVGAIGTLRNVVTGLRAAPGRKGVLYFSDGFSLRAANEPLDPILEQSLNRLIDQATRSRTVIYAINVRLYESNASASLDLGGDPFGMATGFEELDTANGARQAFFESNMEGPAHLATQTGGFFFRNPSDLPLVIRKSLDDQRGYYLLGYAIDQQTADEDRRGRKFHKLSVRLKRPGLSIRSRRGFLGGEDPDDPGARLARAMSPFATSPLDLHLTGFFAGRSGDQSIVRALVYVDASDLKLLQVGRNNKGAAFLEVVASLVDERGTVVRRDQQTFRLRAAEQAVSGGMAYRFDVPVKSPGAYGLRVAAREVVTNKSGSASQFVLVPDLKRKRLTLSGVVLGATEGDGTAAGEAAATHPAVRRFAMPAQLVYSFLVFNAQYAPATSAPSLQAVVRLLRDGKPVYTAPAVDIRTDAKPGDPASVVGTLSLGPQTAPGDYSLAVTVTDALASPDQSSATAVTDFTIVPPLSNP